jgi:transcriptional regulator with XRE-family HTH domain
MFTQEELLESPAYLLTLYQNEIFREVHGYMQENGITQKELAKKLGVSDAYVSQILNGKFNFTLKKLIELGLAIGKIPKIKFVSQETVLRKPKQENKVTNKKDADKKLSKPAKRNIKK